MFIYSVKCGKIFLEHNTTTNKFLLNRRNRIFEIAVLAREQIEPTRMPGRLLQKLNS